MGQRHLRTLGGLQDKIIKLNDDCATQKKIGVILALGLLEFKLVGAWFGSHF